MLFNLKKKFLPLNPGIQLDTWGQGGPQGNPAGSAAAEKPWPYQVLCPNYIGAGIYGSAATDRAIQPNPYNVPAPSMATMNASQLEKPQTFGEVYY